MHWITTTICAIWMQTGCLQPAMAMANNVTQTGFHAMTGLEYMNMTWKGYNTGQYLLKKINLLGYEHHMDWECTRSCFRTTGCTSFTINYVNRICFLTKIDQCLNPNTLYFHAPGFRTFDLRSGEHKEPATTCLSRCTDGCDLCGRPSCSGTYCDSCAKTCWDDLVRDKNGSLLLWPHTLPTGILKVTCSNGWQHIWTFNENGNSVRTFSYGAIWIKPLKLKVVAIYGVGEEAQAHFDGIHILSNKNISVGNYISGTLGNFWEAPFINRTLSVPQNCSCLSFFYPAMMSYSVNGDIPGYAWSTGDPDLDIMRISRIDFWVSAAGTNGH